MDFVDETPVHFELVFVDGILVHYCTGVCSLLMGDLHTFVDETL